MPIPTIPNPPGPKDSHDPNREADTIRSLEGTLARLEALIDALSPFEPVDMTDVNGQRLQVLAIRMGDDAAIVYRLLQLVDASSGGTTMVRIVAGDVDGTIPDAFSTGDTPPYVLTIAESSTVWVEIDIDPSTGERTSVSFGFGTTVPTDDETAGNYYFPIGSVNITSGVLTPANTAFGPITVQICPAPYTNPIEYRATIYGSS